MPPKKKKRSKPGGPRKRSWKDAGQEMRAVFPLQRQLNSLRRNEPLEGRSSKGDRDEFPSLPDKVESRGSSLCFPPGTLAATWRSGGMTSVG